MNIHPPQCPKLPSTGPLFFVFIMRMKGNAARAVIEAIKKNRGSPLVEPAAASDPLSILQAIPVAGDSTMPLDNRSNKRYR